MPLPVSDKASNKEENIRHAAEVLGKSKDRKRVFEAIYFGKKNVKTVEEIVEATGLPRKRVLEEAVRLANQQIALKVRVNGKLAYQKDGFIASNKSKILRVAGRPSEIAKIPTKRNLAVTVSREVIARLPKAAVNVDKITIDDIDNFSEARKIGRTNPPKPMREETIKNLFKRILGEEGAFKDWGGEKNDLYTTRVRIDGKRYYAAFAFKGKGTKGKLTPAKMGSNADQIQRLFTTEAEVFIVQYWGQIDQSVIEQMRPFAMAKSASEGSKTIYYGIIDGQDTQRLLAAYANDSP